MSCDAFEKSLALDAGGDLTPAEAARLEAHLEACAPCRELARAIQESQAALKVLSQEDALEEDALAAWRRRVMARIEGEPRRRVLGWRWAWAVAAAMALLAVLTAPQLLRRTPPVPPVGQAVPPAAGMPNGLPQPPRPPVPVVHRHPRHRRAPAPAPEPLLVKLETPDPNVVIYWFVERKGN
jgi:hypothetical protein